MDRRLRRSRPVVSDVERRHCLGLRSGLRPSLRPRQTIRINRFSPKTWYKKREGATCDIKVQSKEVVNFFTEMKIVTERYWPEDAR